MEWSWLSILAIIISILLIVLIKPLIKIWINNGYNKEWMKTSYFPLLGTYYYMENEKEDIYNYHRQLLQKNPKLQCIATNFKTNVFYLVHDAEMIQKLLANSDKFYKNEEFLLFYQKLIKKGLLGSQGESWKRQRKILSESFQFSQLQDTIPIINEVCLREIQKIDEKIISKSNQNKEEPAGILDICQNITGMIIMQSFFGLIEQNQKYELLITQIVKLFRELATIIFSPYYMFIISPIFGNNPPQIFQNREMKNLDKIIDEVRNFSKIQTLQRMQNFEDLEKKGTNDFLQILLRGYKKEQQDAFEVPEILEQIIQQFITFFFAGTDTTGHLCGILLYLITEHPEVYKKIETQLNEIVGDSKTIDRQHINKLNYLQAVIQETLRLYNPASEIIPRVSKIDQVIGPLKIKQGDSVAALLLLSRSENNEIQDGDKFRPERWIEKDCTINEGFTNIPFSGGARNCIGQHLAMIETQIIIAQFIRKYNFTRNKNIALQMRFGFLYEPENDHLIHINKQSK